jgi:peptide/nickel transport system ATP-binding protein
MQAGRFVESGTADQVLQSPQHPYTQALIAAVPEIPA